MSGQLLLLDETDSTQQEARRRFLAGAGGPLWVLARTQTQGRGRGHRQWISPPGNLHLSLLIRPEAPLRRWPEMSLLASLVAVKALERLAVRLGRPQVRDMLALKWPNDVLLDGRKLGGILLETAEIPHAPAAALPDAPVHAAENAPQRRALIIGWGMNLAAAPPDDQVRWPATALTCAGLDISPPLLFETLRDVFWRWYQVWQAHGARNVLNAWRKRAYGLGARVLVHDGGRRISGRFADLAADGSMLLQTDDGKQLILRAGEVTRVMLPGAPGP